MMVFTLKYETNEANKVIKLPTKIFYLLKLQQCINFERSNISTIFLWQNIFLVLRFLIQLSAVGGPPFRCLFVINLKYFSVLYALNVKYTFYKKNWNLRCAKFCQIYFQLVRSYHHHPKKSSFCRSTLSCISICKIILILKISMKFHSFLPGFSTFSRARTQGCLIQWCKKYSKIVLK